MMYVHLVFVANLSGSYHIRSTAVLASTSISRERERESRIPYIDVLHTAVVVTEKYFCKKIQICLPAGVLRTMRCKDLRFICVAVISKATLSTFVAD